MRRHIKKRRRVGSEMPVARGPFDVGGFPLGRIAHPPGSTYRGGGRLGSTMRAAASKPRLPVDKKQPTAKSLARWEGEGGSSTPRTTTSDRAKKAKAAHTSKKPAATNPRRKEQPKPGHPEGSTMNFNVASPSFSNMEA